MGITREDVLRIARLARLRLSEAEAESFTGPLSAVLDHAEALREAEEGEPAQETAGHAPPGGRAEGPQPGRTETPLADDVPRPDPLAWPPARLAPSFEEGFFTLPRLSSLGDADEASAGDEPPEPR